MDETERLSGSVIVAGIAGTTLPAWAERALGADALGGIILFKRNLGPLEAVAALTRAIHAASPRVPLVAIDQEGGRVARLGPPLVKLPPARRFGELDDPDLTERAGALLGQQLLALGVNLDFAPVLDVDTNPANPIIGDRSYGRTPEAVIRHARAFAKGLASAGVLACGKHFPGHGDTDLDSHLALPRVAHDRARLDAVELAPFRALAKDLPTIMTAHVVFDAIDRTLPATLCREVIDGVLRRALGYEGLIVSDDLEMRAVRDRWGVAESAVRAIDAGCDVLLVCEHEEEVRRAIDALTARAKSDAAFAARLATAAARVRAARDRLARPEIDVARIDEAASAALAADVASR